jgi:hypothetical protein
MWMAEQGARSVIFLSRSAGKSTGDQDFLLELETVGCCGIAVAGCVDIMDDVKRAVAQAPTRIKGVIHLAMVQREGAAVHLSHEDWRAAVTPKVDGAWNLHNCFADSTLDFFVMTSSLLTIGYQPGESNYGAANSFLEAFGQYRRGLGLPASTLLVSPLTEVGFIEENPVAMRKVRGGGYYFLAEREFLDFMEYSIRHQGPNDEEVGLASAGEHDATAPWSDGGYVAMGIRSEVPLSDPTCRISWRRDPRLGMHHNLLAEATTVAESGSAAAELLSRAKVDPTMLDEPDTAGVLAAEIGRRIQAILMQDGDEVNIGFTLQQAGVDSLMAVELRRWWTLAFGVEMTTLELMGGGTLTDLGATTIGKIKETLKAE